MGYRFGRYLASTIPLVVGHCEQAGEGDEELRELCLQVWWINKSGAGLQLCFCMPIFTMFTPYLASS